MIEPRFKPRPVWLQTVCSLPQPPAAPHSVLHLCVHSCELWTHICMSLVQLCTSHCENNHDENTVLGQLENCGQKVQTRSYQMNTFWGCRAQHDDCSVTHWKTVNRVNPEFSSQEKTFFSCFAFSFYHIYVRWWMLTKLTMSQGWDIWYLC